MRSLPDAHPHHEHVIYDENDNLVDTGSSTSLSRMMSWNHTHVVRIADDAWHASKHVFTLENTFVTLVAILVLLVLTVLVLWWKQTYSNPYVPNGEPRKCLRCANCVPGSKYEHLDHPCHAHDECMEQYDFKND